MAYIVNKFDGTLIATVEDGTIDNTTNLRFIGKNYAGYGEIQIENFLHLLENFSNTSAPTKPIEGQLWYDTQNGVLQLFDNTAWKAASNIQKSVTEPSVENSKVGCLLYTSPSPRDLSTSRMPSSA